jgi:hypothetical protein
LAGPSSAGTVTFASSLLKAVYNPKAFIPHAASLRQAFAHCARFPTAASRRSLGRVSVPVWPFTLSGRLPVVALVGRYPTNKLIGRGPIPDRRPFPTSTMRRRLVSGIRPSFPGLSQSRGQVAHVLLTRSPLGATRCCHQVVLARLACIKHAASVHPEPGSNSPSEIVNSQPSPKAPRGCSRRSSAALEPPSLTIRPGRTGGMGDARAYPAPLKAHPLSGCAKEPFRGGKPPTGRGFGTGFSHTVEFSRNVAGMLFGDSPAVPASCHRRSGGTVPRAFQDRQRLPTCPVSVLLVEHHPPRRHRHTEAPPCAPTFWASGRPPNSRRIESSWRSATPCLPMPTPLASFRRGPRS